MKRAILLLALISAPAGAQTWSDSGLETAKYKYIFIILERLGSGASNIGLTADSIYTRVELRLRSAGLTPDIEGKNDDSYLYVNVFVVGAAYTVEVRYERRVIFTAGDQQYIYYSPTWESLSTGIHGNNAAHIMNSLDRRLDKFLNEYLKVNQK